MSTPEPLEAAGGDPGWFIDKWRAHWPDWTIAEVFLSADARPLAAAWQALQSELLDAAWANEDPRPGEAKLGWWMEELHGWAQGRRRHPLGSVLQRQEAPWAAFAQALPALAATRERPRDAAEARESLRPVAAPAAAVESALFAGVDASDAITACWLQARLARHAARAAPLAALALSPDDPGAAWRAELLAGWPSTAGLPRPRRLLAALARIRLQRGDAARPLPAWTALWAGWRAARD